MKKIILSVFALLFCFEFAFAQKNLSVDVDDEIYSVLEIAEMKGFCSFLPGAKPYTVSRIFKAIDEILEHEDELKPSEIELLEKFKAKHEINSEKKNSASHLAVQTKDEKYHFSFLYDFSLEANVSGGIYNKSDFNSVGFDLLPEVNFRGDITKFVSYGFKGIFDLTYMPLKEVGIYSIGYPWYEKDVEDYFSGDLNDDGTPKYSKPESERFVKKFLNNSYLPYSYKKPWDGQVYLLSNMSASGTEGWATEFGVSGTVLAEIKASFLDDRLTIGAGRQSHEWAAMDNGSSLVLNKQARPFFEFNTGIEMFSWLKFSTLSGILEYPNADYMNSDSYPEDKDGVDDSYFWQNAFSVNMIELNFKYLHLDFGSSVVYPKRFEIGYLFPLFIYVEYQNHTGDCDNLALFGDIMLRKPGVGKVWASIYFDELNIQNNWFTETRVMFSGQVGAKAVIPWLPFASVSTRYTKIEPYCYTHHAINYAPSYNHYIMENYTNNGESLGYYLPPNSDEFFFRFEMKPRSFLSTALQYQFVRHGADYGSQQVPGSSLYSELSRFNRDELKKYFLHDGAYNWMHMVKLETTFEHKNVQRDLQLSLNLGFLYSYYTMIDSDNYDRSIYGNNGNCKNTDFSTPYHFVNTDEYPVQFGVVMGFGFKVLF